MENIYTLIEKKDEEGLKKLLTLDNIDIDFPDYKGCTLLHIAAYSGNTSIIKILIDNGAAVDKQDKALQTALHWAVLSRHSPVSTTDYLLKSGANIHALNMYMQTPLKLAIVNNQEAVVKLLLERGAGLKINLRDWQVSLKTTHLLFINSFLNNTKISQHMPAFQHAITTIEELKKALSNTNYVDESALYKSCEDYIKIHGYAQDIDDIKTMLSTPKSLSQQCLFFLRQNIDLFNAKELIEKLPDELLEKISEIRLYH